MFLHRHPFRANLRDMGQPTGKANWATYSAALCQVFDSIYLDVPMSRVKFNVNSEYAYVQNFKILQSTSKIPPRTPKPTTREDCP